MAGVGVLLKRCTYGAAVGEAKEQILASIARFNEILRGGAKKSVNLEAEGKMKVVIVSEGGGTRKVQAEHIDDELFRELTLAQSFELEIYLERNGPVKPRTMFWYDEDTHLKNSCGIEFIGEFGESITFSFLGLLGRLNEVKSAAIRSMTDSVVNRMQSLWEDVFRMYVGESMTKSVQKFNLRKYEMDSLMLNIFGNIIKVRENA